MNTIQIILYGIACLLVGIFLGIKIGKVLLAKKLYPKLKELNAYVDQLMKISDKLQAEIDNKLNGEEDV